MSSVGNDKADGEVAGCWDKSGAELHQYKRFLSYRKSPTSLAVEDLPRSNSCPASARRMDGHPIFSKTHTSGVAGYCINCPICEGKGCDWGRANESGESTSISSFDSDVDDQDDTDDCSSITISDSDDEGGVSGYYDLTQFQGVGALSGSDKRDAHSAFKPGVNDDDVDYSNAEEELVSPASSNGILYYNCGLLNGDIECENDERDGEMEFDGVHDTGNDEGVIPFEIIKTDDHGQVCDVIYVNVPSTKHRVNTSEEPDVHVSGNDSYKDFDSHRQFMDKGRLLVRKTAVRRKGYTWRSKTFPKNSKNSSKTEEQSRKCASLPQTGSSLDLAPSLLNIFDGKVASGIESTCPGNGLEANGRKQDQQEDDDEDDTAPHPSQLPSPLSSAQRTAVSNTNESSSPSSSSLISTSSNVVYRSGKLPSISQPLDRPVSLMDADCGPRKDSMDHVDSKKRPLSVSSMSSVSTSSLPRVRKKRANGNPRSDIGQIIQSNIGEEVSNDHHGLPPELVSESYSSMDSGCIESDRNGERCYDAMSVTSSSEGASVRGDTTLGANASCSSLGIEASDTSLPIASLDKSDSSLNSSSKVFNSFRSQCSTDSSPVISKTVSGLNEDFHDRLTSDVVYPPSALKGPQKRDCSFDEDSYVIRKMGSYINRNSAALPVDFTGPLNDDSAEGMSAINSPGNERRWGASSRNEARERFFSNYEENYNKYASSPIDTESSLETLADFLADQDKISKEPTSPSTPSTSTPSPNTQEGSDFPDKIFRTTVNPSNSAPATNSESPKADASPSSPTSPSTSYFDSRGSSSLTSPSSPINKSASSRSSRKRDSQDPKTSPSTPAYVSYVQRVVMEIVDTEKSYMTSLEDIIFGYLEPLEHLLNMEVAKDDIMCLFSNISDIYEFNRRFLYDLEKTDTDPIKVAECFVKHNKGFVIYTEYCTNYPSAVEVLTRFMKHPELNQLCKERQMALGHGLPLGAYLLRPVQRILKYHLLLQNIIKHYEKEKRDVPVLKQAFQHMTQMAHHINEMKRKHEHAVRIQEIQSQLEDYVGEDLTRLGDLVLESTFQVYGAKASRQVFLFERGLLISKKKEGGMLSCKTFIKCSNLMLVEVIPNEPLSFHAIPFDNPRAQYTLQARNMEQKRRWCQEIKRLILESFKGHIPDSVKNLVMELGRDHDDDFVSKEALDAVRKHQHTAPEYLEKRRVRRKSGSRMPDFSLLRPQKAKRNGQRKNEKVADNRRTESKSPELQRKAISKLIFPQHTSLGSSLPTTPITEPIHENFLKSSDPSTSSNPLSHSTPWKTPDSLRLSTEVPKITGSHSSSDISLISNSKSSLNNMADVTKDKKRGSDIDVVRRASSFRTAIRSNPIASVDLSEEFPMNGNEKEKLMPKLKKSRRRMEWKKYSKSDMIDNNSKAERISEDEGSSADDEYVLIKENSSGFPTEINNSIEAISAYQGAEMNQSEINLSEAEKTCNGVTKQSGMHSRSSSLPALVHTVNNSKNVKPTPQTKDQPHPNKHFQSSDNVCHNGKVKGRLSRRDLQDAATTNINGRYIKKKQKSDDADKDYVGLLPPTKEIDLRLDSVKAENTIVNKRVPAFHDSFARHVAEKKASQKSSLHGSNACRDFGSQDLRSHIYSKGVKTAKLTNWNSVDKLTKGSMSDLSHVHENPWELNSQTSRATSPQSFDNGTPLGRSKRSATLPPESMHERDNLDWLVYLKRNSLFSESGDKSNRKSTSVLEQGPQGKEILDLKRRISAQSPYATPPRHFMTIENMKRFGGSSKAPEKVSQNEDKSRQYKKSPMASSEILSNATADPIPIRPVSSRHPRCVSSSSLNDKRSINLPSQRGRRPYSMEMDRLTDESNKMVAEMEDYISRTSSSESVKSPNKFPTTLPTISIEEQEDEISNDNNRLSMVSSVSTSSYESQASSSSDGLAGTLKSKLHNWASATGRKSETYENMYQSTVLSDDEDDTIETQISSASPPKSNNTFVPPHTQSKTVAEKRGLENVLREHSLGSASLGSRMANSLPIPMSPKSEEKTFPQEEDNTQIATKTEATIDRNLKTSSQIIKFNENISSEQSRYSLPATKEAVEALMPPALRDCDIQQSDSGFSIHSNSSNVSESISPINIPQSPNELLNKSSNKVMSSPKTPRTSQSPQSKRDVGLQRQNSYESIDSTDSFYERRLSLALSTDGFELAPTIIHVYDDEMPQGQVDTPQRKSIKEYVQQIEDKYKPIAPKICEVRRRPPGSMIQQKLQSLKENVIHGRTRSTSTSSRHGSEDREFSRSKSQPPSQHRRQMKPHNNAPQSIDDINVSVGFTHHASQPKISPARSVEHVYLSRSREYINLSPSKENLTNIDGKFSLPKVTVKNAFHVHSPGHERDWNSYQLESNEDSQEMGIKGQFVHKIKQESSPLAIKQDQFFSLSDDEDEGVLADEPTHKIDQLSSEVDNLVIMKGWVKALITKFQNK